MKKLTIIILVVLFTSCGNKKAELVELIKKTKNEWYEASMKRGAYSSAANDLRAYQTLLEFSKKNNSKQSYLDAQTYKKSYENDIKDIKNESDEVIKDHNKLQSIAYKWAFKCDDLQLKIDSLELELKKY